MWSGVSQVDCDQGGGQVDHHLVPAFVTVGDAERGVDPAVGVHDAGGDVVDDAVDGVPDEGLRGDEEVGCEDEEHGGLAVQLEDGVVDRDLG